MREPRRPNGTGGGVISVLFLRLSWDNEDNEDTEEDGKVDPRRPLEMIPKDISS
jgi:hypothetical protein